MLNPQRAITNSQNDHHQDQDHDHDDDDDQEPIRDIHALTPPQAPAPVNRGRRREAWETGSHRSSSMSVSSEGGASSENFTTMSREFNALVLAGSAIETTNENTTDDHLARIAEDEIPDEETNPWAIVPDHNPLDSGHGSRQVVGLAASGGVQGEVSVQRVKKEEVETKISAWQNAKIAKVNNRFKREEAVINGWESEQVQKATSWMKKVERKLEEKRAKALEKMQNKVAKAHRKAEERRASSEGKRGTKLSKILEAANLMRAVGSMNEQQLVSLYMTPPIPIRDRTILVVDSLTSCIVPSPLRANTCNIKTCIQMIQLNVQYGGSLVEDPNAHISNFLEVCNTFNYDRETKDAVCLRLFPYSLKDMAKW